MPRYEAVGIGFDVGVSVFTGKSFFPLFKTPMACPVESISAASAREYETIHCVLSV
jgi:hypothetical protein